MPKPSKHPVIRAIGFDFDDTIVMTEGKKHKLLEDAIYESTGVRRSVWQDYKKLRGKYNRRQKIKILLKKALGKKPSEKQINEVSREFSNHYKVMLQSCPLFECTNMINELKQQVDFLFLLSLEDKGEVMEAAKHCGVSGYFDEILGGPKSKAENFKHILRKHGLKSHEVMYIGDSNNDIISSKKLKIKAVGIQEKFSYRKLLKKLGADFTFSSLCKVPFSKLINSGK